MDGTQYIGASRHYFIVWSAFPRLKQSKAVSWPSCQLQKLTTPIVPSGRSSAVEVVFGEAQGFAGRFLIIYPQNIPDLAQTNDISIADEDSKRWSTCGLLCRERDKIAQSLGFFIKQSSFSEVKSPPLYIKILTFSPRPNRIDRLWTKKRLRFLLQTSIVGFAGDRGIRVGKGSWKCRLFESRTWPDR